MLDWGRGRRCSESQESRKEPCKGREWERGYGRGVKKCSCGLQLFHHLKACRWIMLIALSSSTIDSVNHSCNRITEKTNIIPLLPLNEHFHNLGRLSCNFKRSLENYPTHRLLNNQKSNRQNPNYSSTHGCPCSSDPCCCTRVYQNHSCVSEINGNLSSSLSGNIPSSGLGF